MFRNFSYFITCINILPVIFTILVPKYSKALLKTAVINYIDNIFTIRKCFIWPYSKCIRQFYCVKITTGKYIPSKPCNTWLYYNLINPINIFTTAYRRFTLFIIISSTDSCHRKNTVTIKCGCNIFTYIPWNLLILSAVIIKTQWLI